MRWIWHTALAGTLLAGGVYGCGRAADVASVALPALLPISDQDEQAVGLQAAQQVVAKTPIYQNQAVQDYVNRLGQKMAARSDRTNIPYTFTVLDSADPDAFALPGGYVFITTGMIKAMQNEAQLAGVLGHEAGHVAARHSVDMIKQAALAQGVQVAVLGTDSGAAQAVGNVVRELILRGYGRAKELEADRLGATYSSAEGYAPAQLTDFLQVLQTATGSGELGWLAPLSTHPPVAERVKELQAYIQSQGLTGAALNAEAFMSATAALR